MSSTQRRVLERLSPIVAEHGMYLGGGTAVALHLGHRRSLDLDWFAGQTFGDPLGFAHKLRDSSFDVEIRGVESGTLHVDVDGVLVSFLEYRYPTLQPPVAWEEMGCRLASLEDLATMKLAAVAQRGSKKDFVDIYSLATDPLSIEEMLDLYQDRYGIADVGHVFYSLTYFDDADEEPMPEMIAEIEWSTVKETILREVRRLAESRSRPGDNSP